MLRTESQRTADGSEAQKPNPSPAANYADQPTQNRHGIRPGENDRVKLDVRQTACGPGDAETRIRPNVGQNLRRVSVDPMSVARRESEVGNFAAPGEAANVRGLRVAERRAGRKGKTAAHDSQRTPPPLEKRVRRGWPANDRAYSFVRWQD